MGELVGGMAELMGGGGAGGRYGGAGGRWRAWGALWRSWWAVWPSCGGGQGAGRNSHNVAPECLTAGSRLWGALAGRQGLDVRGLNVSAGGNE